MLIVCLVTTRFSNRLVNAIRITKSFVDTIAGGELHAKFDEDILKRNDELGEMGCCLIEMQKSLQGLVEQDILTGLYNRRSGENLLRQTCENYRKEGTPFCVAIGDIDHFKSVNDTYGHGGESKNGITSPRPGPSGTWITPFFTVRPPGTQSSTPRKPLPGSARKPCSESRYARSWLG